MEYQKLGNSDLNVSRICLGCMGFGDSENGMHTWTINEEKTREIIKLALDNGINFFDTAIGYQNGTSEQYLGRALEDFAKREDVYIATKFLPRSSEEVKNNISMREHIIDSLNQSLSNLGVDYVDLYIYHMWDYNSDIEEVMETLNELINEGKIRYIGISNCFAYQLAKANDLAEKNGWAKFISVQGHHNLIFREEEREMLPLAKDDNIGLTPYSSLASGRLSRRDNTSKRANEDTVAKSKYGKTEAEDELIIERVEELALKHNVSISEVALAWLLTKVTSPIVGATKPHHVETAVNSVDLKLTAEEIAYLEEPYVPHELVGVMANIKGMMNTIEDAMSDN
ncbi:general stress protein 69 [Methanobrevibacter woesei]|uniref:General stress protein 69 n=1 Tax=Methanobrevibacter woesei TaxID=190976 RepID=A0A2U1S8D4_9EURY|nr:aldo/keto reductase [Methanobrevibacter woesei]PWB86377.1 general stress protein 69 [Methanobrevibacter woesei]